ncbi:pyrroline-5-carboxylate reductase [Desulfitobacterium dichloroeliminans LMG P-21439]|uniref:Pyrroline-5-carboxylate reductase n=1 Tax=Desulfitobacterium dichloroeliminans (strain LMG P-21439 / DCA1) TaxID=871963 RepID=L0F7W6_DESDL|nr:pyrroline-5-carboxylate reductase [Desulfitobacterium dichloroeliminans]AGA69115.1 pyrroline-5-carboxylate reductase [Desulfitobacterium dichloroeliminans LMG P-21439]
MQKIGFIGAGNMAEAIIKGLATTGRYEIRVTNRSNQVKLEKMREQYGVIPASFTETIKDSEIILLAVKPKDVNEVMSKISEVISDNQLFISVAAGIPLALLERHLPRNPLVRAMPNTSSAVMHSMTGLVKGQGVGEKDTKDAENIFGAVGRFVWVAEEQMNPLIAMSGSGPAYFYLFTEALVKAGVEMGVSLEVAEILAKETIIGAAKMLDTSDKSPSELRVAVTSPKGTTQEALNVFWENGLEELVARAAKACKARAEEMERVYLE